MYLSWNLAGHHKFRRPGDDKAIDWTVLVFPSEAEKDAWLLYFSKGPVRKSHRLARRSVPGCLQVSSGLV